MSVVEFLQRLLEERWHESIAGRPNDVPRPAIIETTQDVKRRLNTEDVIHVTAPGTTRLEPKGFREIGLEDDMQLAFRAQRRDTPDGVHDDPFKRMFGTRDGNNEAHRWPGIVGEAQRIVLSVYQGHKEFDKITPPRIDDLSDQTGPNEARAEMGVDTERISFAFDTGVDP